MKRLKIYIVHLIDIQLNVRYESRFVQYESCLESSRLEYEALIFDILR